MKGILIFFTIIVLALLSITDLGAQPKWVKGTPSVASAGTTSITLNYGIDRTGTVYIIIYNYNNNIKHSSSTVRSLAIGGPSGSLVATAVLPVGSQNINKTLQATLNVINANQIHTIFIVAASSLGILQSSPVRLTATTLSCPPVNAGTGGNECDLDFTFSAVPSVSPGRWTKTTGPGNATFSPDASAPNATVTVTEYGVYTFTWTVVTGSCSSSAVVTVTFYQQPLANPGTGGNNCGLFFRLNAVPSIGAGTWTVISGPGRVRFSPNTNTPNAEITVSQYGTYALRWREVNGICSDEATVTINFVEQVNANAGNGGDECDKDFKLNAIPGTATGTWSMINGPGSAVFSPNPNRHDATVTVTEFGSYDFAWTEINNQCSSTDIIRVTFHDLPSVSAGEDIFLCEGDTVQLHGVGSGSLHWSPHDLVNNPDVYNPYAFPLITTIFTATLTDQYGCINSDQVKVEVREKPLAYAGPDQILEFKFETNLAALIYNIYEKGVWRILSGTGKFSDENDKSTIVSGLSINENLFIWTVTNEVCPPSLDTVKITVTTIVTPTLITPNMDGKNDFFVINGLETWGKTEIIIFNRWGAQIYRNKDYDNSWNGLDSNGKPVSDDTYFYILNPGKNEAIKGYIVIKRTYEKNY